MAKFGNVTIASFVWFISVATASNIDEKSTF